MKRKAGMLLLVGTPPAWALGYLLIFASRVRRFCSSPNPNDYETWWDFQAVAALYVYAPWTLPLVWILVLVALALVQPYASSRKTTQEGLPTGA